MTTVGKSKLNAGETSSAPEHMARQANQAFEQYLQITSAPGVWRFPTNPDRCCIYRVPHRIRQVNPSAYTPQLVILGPLHHSLKAQASKHQLENIENTRFMGYFSMERHKFNYLIALANRFDGEDTFHGFRNVIKAEEEAIRASYSDSTTWIQSEDFVKMILLDSGFILEFMLRCSQKGSIENEGDILMDNLLLNSSVYEDLILLENQLPLFILEKLFDGLIKRLYKGNKTLCTIITQFFGLEGRMIKYLESKHFTDLLRCVRVNKFGKEKKEGEDEVNVVDEKGKEKGQVEVIVVDEKRKGKEKEDEVVDKKGKEREGETEVNVAGEKGKEGEGQEIEVNVVGEKGKEGEGQDEANIVQNYRRMDFLYSAEKLHHEGIKFKVIEKEFSLDVKFENGYLELPSFLVHDGTEIEMRNIMAFEQCHYPHQAHVCSYIFFLDSLIDTVKDVDILVEQEILKSWMGDHGLVAEMVNKLSMGMVRSDHGSCYQLTACRIEAHYKNRINRLWARLKRVYFSDLLTGTATSAAIAILLFTAIQAGTSIAQVFHKR